MKETFVRTLFSNKGQVGVCTDSFDYSMLDERNGGKNSHFSLNALNTLHDVNTINIQHWENNIKHMQCYKSYRMFFNSLIEIVNKIRSVVEKMLRYYV